MGAVPGAKRGRSVHHQGRGRHDVRLDVDTELAAAQEFHAYRNLTSSDRYGRKLVDLHRFVLFTAASAACGLAPTPPVPVAVRVVQAGGAAMLQANSVALVTTSAPAGRRCRPARRRWA
jgi:hypothetical protein